MVRRCRGKRRGVFVTGIALRRSRDMAARFSFYASGDAMAACAITRSYWPSRSSVIHCSRGKCGSVLMAGIALCRSRYMAARFRFHTSGYAMAGIATAGDRWGGSGVIEDRAFETGC